MAPERAFFDQARKLRWDPNAFPTAKLFETDFEDKEMASAEKNRAKLFTVNPKVVKTNSKAVANAMKALGMNPRGFGFETALSLGPSRILLFSTTRCQNALLTSVSLWQAYLEQMSMRFRERRGKQQRKKKR